jgi:hypothetical protein
MIIGLIFCAIGLIHGIFKYFVIRSAARDIYNGGGVPVMDFVVFVPLWLAVGSSLLLKHTRHHPFPFFGLVAYFILAIVFYALMALEYRLGKPEVERQLEMIKARNRANHAMERTAHALYESPRGQFAASPCAPPSLSGCRSS